MKAAVYMRVSSDEQRERQTIENQREFAGNFLRVQPAEVYDWYADDGVTSAIPFGKRPEGSRLLQDAAAGRFDTVLVYRVDRLARNALDLLRLADTLEKHRVSLRSMSEPFETATPAGRAMFTMLGAFAQFEKDTIKERTMQGKARNVREGRWSGGQSPFGYRIVESRLVIEPAEAELIRLIYRMYVDGLPAIQIADYLNARDEKTPHVRKGRRDASETDRWWDSTLRNLMKNPIYKGERIYRKIRRPTVEGKPGRPQRVPENERVYCEAPALVSPELWQAAQDRMRRNFLMSSRHNTKVEYLLRGLIRCGSCGGAYAGNAIQTTRRNGDPCRYVYYRCTKGGPAFGERRCYGIKVRAEELERAVWADILEYVNNPGPVLAQLEQRIAAEVNAQAPLAAEQASVDRALAGKQEERQRVIGLIRRGLISDAEAEQELQQVAAEVQALQARQDGLQVREHQVDALRRRLEGAGALLGRLRGAADTADFAKRRELAELLVEGVVVESDGKGRGRGREPRAVVTYCFEDLDCRASDLTVTCD